ncbi:hypothetical protein RND81_09G161700 [Saponaria officinalis]|uniref:FBD domain-containing protein n=1 Tax=Saponaria officinalis TaxID=3572 RepID=A0AAW1IMC9_SAPOF
MSSSKSDEIGSDLISTMPAIVTDKILKNLPLSVAAKTSILSRTWRRIWLSCNYLVFDEAFWEEFCKLDECFDWQKGSNIISNILFHHNGDIFSIHIVLRPQNAALTVDKNACLSQWLSLLSRNRPKKITLINWAAEWDSLVFTPSYIFRCTELVKLKLQCFVLNAPPFDFKGFPHLRNLELFYLKFNHGIDMLWSLVADCPSLVSLNIYHCLGMEFLDVDAPGLEKLIIRGAFVSLRLKNVPRLLDVSLCSVVSEMNDTETVVATINSLADSYELRSLSIEENLSKLLGAGGINKPLSVAFNHLHRLCLTELILIDSDVFWFTVAMLQSCPFIKDLEISITSNDDNDAIELMHEYCNDTDEYKLSRLQTVKITGITGSHAELELIKFVLAISVVLEKLFFKCEALDAVSELKVLRHMIRFPRASTNAQLVCLDE